jgi:ankyrin repeat protein
MPIRESMEGSVEAVKELLRIGAAVNAVDEEGKTALIWASSKGHVEV